MSRTPTIDNQPLPSVPPEEAGLSPEKLARIAPAMQAYVDSGRLPGMVSVVVRHGRIGYYQAVGRMDIERDTAMRADAVFRIYSLTKPIIAVAVLRLLEQGKVRLDDPLSEYVPAFGDVKVYSEGSDATTQLSDPSGPILLKHLLTHTSGLTYGYFGDTPVDRLYRQVGLANPSHTIKQFSESAARLPLLFSPGTAWNYSISFDVLGRVIEVASGRALDRFLEEEIFLPLGMHETAFHVRPEMDGRIPVLYSPGPDRRLCPSSVFLDARYLEDGRLLSGGGGLLSTLADYLSFSQMLLNGGEFCGHRMLARETVTLMARNHLAPSLTPIVSPMVGHDGYGQGLGGAVLVDPGLAGVPDSARIYRWWGYAGTFFWIDREADLVGMVWTQLTPGRTYPLEQDFQRLVYSAVVR